MRGVPRGGVRAADVPHLQRTLGNRAVTRLLAAEGSRRIQTKIKWNPEARSKYATSARSLVEELHAEYSHVDDSVIVERVQEVEAKNAWWTPFQAYQAIRKWLSANHPIPPEDIALDGTNITSNEARWYFLSDFKTFMEAIIDGKYSFKFVNTPDDNHAEDNMMARIDQFMHEKGWDEDFSESHSLLIRINNSPCTRCARRLYDWQSRDLFDEFQVQFANLYEKESGFTKASALLRSGGVVMNLFSVVENLLPLIKVEGVKKAELEQRKKKDQTESMDWKEWQENN